MDVKGLDISMYLRADRLDPDLDYYLFIIKDNGTNPYLTMSTVIKPGTCNNGWLAMRHTAADTTTAKPVTLKQGINRITIFVALHTGFYQPCSEIKKLFYMDKNEEDYFIDFQQPPDEDEEEDNKPEKSELEESTSSTTSTNSEISTKAPETVTTADYISSSTENADTTETVTTADNISSSTENADTTETVTTADNIYSSTENADTTETVTAAENVPSTETAKSTESTENADTTTAEENISSTDTTETASTTNNVPSTETANTIEKTVPTTGGVEQKPTSSMEDRFLPVLTLFIDQDVIL